MWQSIIVCWAWWRKDNDVKLLYFDGCNKIMLVNNHNSVTDYLTTRQYLYIAVLLGEGWGVTGVATIMQYQYKWGGNNLHTRQQGGVLVCCGYRWCLTFNSGMQQISNDWVMYVCMKMMIFSVFQQLEVALKGSITWGVETLKERYQTINTTYRYC